MNRDDALAGFPVVIDQDVRWGDLDAYGHVNNTVFFRFFESARIAYFEAIGFVSAGAASDRFCTPPTAASGSRSGTRTSSRWARGSPTCRKTASPWSTRLRARSTAQWPERAPG